MKKSDNNDTIDILYKKTQEIDEKVVRGKSIGRFFVGIIIILLIVAIVVIRTNIKENEEEEWYQQQIKYVEENALQWLIDSGYEIEITDEVRENDIFGTYERQFFYFNEYLDDYTISNVNVIDTGKYSFNLEFHTPVTINGVKATLNVSTRLKRYTEGGITKIKEDIDEFSNVKEDVTDVYFTFY